MKFANSLLALTASASAHMILQFPVPYGDPNNSPLENSGSDFPCKATGPESYTIKEMNQWNAGQTQNVSFTGSAVHGGGSCQFSITTDMKPTKQTQWKVIHSIVGGCPSNVSGNLPDNASGHGAATFPVTLPSELPSGQYTMAWTWFNKVGNREMYMNCAPIQVGGSGGSEGDASTKAVSSAIGSLPDMFVANLPRESCNTANDKDLVFPDPGQSVVFGQDIDKGSVQGTGCAKMALLGAGSGSLGAPSKPSDGSSPAPPTPKQPSADPAPSNPGGVFAPGASPAPSQPAAPPAQAPPAPVAPPAAPSQVPTAPQAPSQPANSTPSGEGTPCTNDGAVVCIGSNQFGLCNHGFAYPMALSDGTSCSDGVISRRSVRFPRAHLHRRHIHASGLI